MIRTVYIVTKRFISGNLVGLVIEDRCPVAFKVGQSYGGGWLGPKYTVDACYAVTERVDK